MTDELNQPDGVSRFSTTLLAPDVRFSTWKESIGVIFDVTTSPFYSADKFEGRIHSFLLDTLMLSRCRTTPQSFERDKNRFVSDGLDHYVVQYFAEGSQSLFRNGREFGCIAGDVIVYDLADVHHTETGCFENLSMVIPRQKLAPLLRYPDSQQGHILQRDNPATIMLVRHIIALFELCGSGFAGRMQGLDEASIAVSAAAINNSSLDHDQLAAGVQQSVLMQCKLFIEQHLHDQMLNAGLICAAHGLSRTVLYRFFNPWGGVARYIRSRRLRKSCAAICENTFQQMSIGQIAFAYGFTSESHFSRAFKEELGITPSELRRSGANHLLKYQNHINSGLWGDRSYENWISDLEVFASHER